MDKAEAILAVDLNAICESGNVQYYAYGNERIKEPGKSARESIILHDLKTNSITHAEIERTVVVDWKAPEWIVNLRLKRIREKQQAQKQQ